jgi:hypothetical protein
MTAAFVGLSVVAYLLLPWICMRHGIRRGWAKVFGMSDNPIWFVLQVFVLFSMLGVSLVEVFSRGAITSMAYGGLNLGAWPAMVFATFILARCAYVIAWK